LNDGSQTKKYFKTFSERKGGTRGKDGGEGKIGKGGRLGRNGREPMVWGPEGGR